MRLCGKRFGRIGLGFLLDGDIPLTILFMAFFQIQILF
jgi:hypothetical protein